MLEYPGYLDSLQRAQSAANLGLGAGAAGALLPQQYYAGQLGLLNQGIGPYGTTQSQSMRSDPFSSLLGLGLTGASLFMPGGLFAAGALKAAPIAGASFGK